MTKVLFTGSFDPITKGHMDIIEQASNLFDEVLVAILINPEKKNVFFSQKERLEIIKEIYKNKKNIAVISSNKLGVDLAKEKDCKIIIRGLRSILDFEYEYQLSLTNTDLSNNEVTTVCLFSKPEYQNISSSTVKQIFKLNRDISKYVNPYVEKKMNDKKEEIKKLELIKGE